MDAFIGRVTKYTVYKRGKKLQYYKVYVPKRIGEKHIKNRTVLVIICKPEWKYLEKMYPILPDETKKQLCRQGIVPAEYCGETR